MMDINRSSTTNSVAIPMPDGRSAEVMYMARYLHDFYALVRIDGQVRLYTPYEPGCLSLASIDSFQRVGDYMWSQSTSEQEYWFYRPESCLIIDRKTGRRTPLVWCDPQDFGGYTLDSVDGEAADTRLYFAPKAMLVSTSLLHYLFTHAASFAISLAGLPVGDLRESEAREFLSAVDGMRTSLDMLTVLPPVGAPALPIPRYALFSGLRITAHLNKMRDDFYASGSASITQLPGHRQSTLCLQECLIHLLDCAYTARHSPDN